MACCVLMAVVFGALMGLWRLLPGAMPRRKPDPLSWRPKQGGEHE